MQIPYRKIKRQLSKTLRKAFYRTNVRSRMEQLLNKGTQKKC